MMDWEGLVALLPLLMCGGMMFGGTVLAWLGIRRRDTPETGNPEGREHRVDARHSPTPPGREDELVGR